MKFIRKKAEPRKNTPHYKFTIDFMHGDADGYDREVLTFEEGDIGKYEGIILATVICCAAYPNGRGGYDEYNGLPEYDAFFCEDVGIDDYDHLDPEDKLTEDELHKKIREYLKEYNPTEIYIEHPCDPPSGISSSFDGYSLIHIDAEGNKSKVEIEFSEEEKKKIKKAKTFFKD